MPPRLLRIGPKALLGGEQQAPVPELADGIRALLHAQIAADEHVVVVRQADQAVVEGRVEVGAEGQAVGMALLPVSAWEGGVFYRSKLRLDSQFRIKFYIENFRRKDIVVKLILQFIQGLSISN